MKKITLPNSEHSAAMQLDFEFYKSILSKDESKANEVINELLTREQHKERNASALWSEFISQPAFGYAKLAKLNGMEVKADSTFIPVELLAIRPLEKYEIVYPFLNGLL